MKSNQQPRYVTPVGVAQYPYLVTPDTKFDSDGVYSVRLVFDKMTPDLEFLVKDLQKTLESFTEECKKDPAKAKFKSRIVQADFITELDDGTFEMKFKQKAVIKSVKGTYEVKLPIFDSKGKPLINPKLGSGSRIKVCFSAVPYFMQASKQTGLTFRPVAIQVIELKEWNDGGSMESYGFTQEDGYEANDIDNLEEDSPFEEDEEAPQESGDF